MTNETVNVEYSWICETCKNWVMHAKTPRADQCPVCSLRGRVAELEETNKRLTERNVELLDAMADQLANLRELREQLSDDSGEAINWPVIEILDPIVDALQEVRK